MRDRFKRLRGDTVAPAKPKPPPLHNRNYEHADTATDGIKIGCPYCDNTTDFELYVHKEDDEKQFYRCLECLGTFDFRIVDCSRPKLNARTNLSTAMTLGRRRRRPRR